LLPRIPCARISCAGNVAQAFNVGPSPHIEEERARLQEEVKRTLAEQMHQMERMRRTAEDALRDEFNAILEAQRSGGWRAIFCCCFPQAQVRHLGIERETCLTTDMVAQGWQA
jgi:hypothetical protein